MVTRRSIQGVALRWRDSSRNSLNRQILVAALIVGGAAGVVALASAAREVLVAATFGTDDALDALIVAIVLPTFVVNVIGGSFAAALVPAYVRIQEREGADAAQQLFSGVLALGVALLVAAVLLLAGLGGVVLPLLTFGFSPEKYALTERLFRMFLPVIVLGGISSIWNAMLNAGSHFALAALSRGLIPLTTVVALYLGRQHGIYALLVGMIGGYALQLCALGAGLARQGLSLRPHWPAANVAVHQVFEQYVPMVIGAALLSSTALVDQAVAATLPPGSVSAFAYGTKVIVLATGLGSAALGTAVLPFFSKMVAAANWAQVRHTLRTFSLLVGLTTVAAAAVLLVNSRSIVEILFQRGAFSATDTALVAEVQALYALQLPFFGLGILYVRLISALGGNRVLMWQAAICLPINAVLDIIFARALGVPGIALATSVMYLVSFCILWFMSRRLLRHAAVRSLTDNQPEARQNSAAA